MKNGSRLLVLVECTTATRDLWPLWRQRALEPILTKAENGAFGAYEMNLVAFASDSGESDGVIRSGDWTRDVDRFRGYCESLTFEGNGKGNGVGEAVTEATYLEQQPSTLGHLAHVGYHVLLFSTGCLGRLHILSPFSQQQSDDARLAPLDLLSHLRATSGWTVSIVTERCLQGMLPLAFAKWVGKPTAEKCVALSKGQHCAMLIDPRWTDGYAALFPDNQIFPAVFNEVSEMTQRTPVASSMPSPSSKTEISGTTSFPFTATQHKRQASFKTDRGMADAVVLSQWKRHELKRRWTDCADKMMEPESKFASMDEYALEKELLRLESPQECDREIYSEKGSKVDSATSYTGGPASLAHSSSAQRNKNLSIADTRATPATTDQFVIDAAAQRTMAESGSSCSQGPSQTGVSDRKKLLLSSATSGSIEHLDIRDGNLLTQGTMYSAPQQIMDEQLSRRRNYQAGRERNTESSNRPFLASEQRHPADPSYHRVDNLTTTEFLRSGPEAHDTKRTRTRYERPSHLPSTTPVPTASPPIDQEELSPIVKSPGHYAQESRRQTLSNRYNAPPHRTLMPPGGMGWNVEWSGPLFLAGPIMRQTKPQKLFDMEILCKRQTGITSWPSELVIHSLVPRETRECHAACVINLKWESVTDMGRTFSNWLTEKQLVAVADLHGDQTTRMIISVRDDSYDRCQLVAGFERERVL